jgi:hypothetical protein
MNSGLSEAVSAHGQSLGCVLDAASCCTPQSHWGAEWVALSHRRRFHRRHVYSFDDVSVAHSLGCSLPASWCGPINCDGVLVTIDCYVYKR